MMKSKKFSNRYFLLHAMAVKILGKTFVPKQTEWMLENLLSPYVDLASYHTLCKRVYGTDRIHGNLGYDLFYHFHFFLTMEESRRSKLFIPFLRELCFNKFNEIINSENKNYFTWHYIDTAPKEKIIEIVNLICNHINKKIEDHLKG